MTAARRERALEPILIFTTLVTAVISSLGAPLVLSIAKDMNVPLHTAQWSLTATLLVAAVSSPIMGRLSDGPYRRATLLWGLTAVAIGSVMSAVAPGFGWLIAGRALQGIGLGLVPVTMTEARDHLPRERVQPTIALLSVCAAAGVGAGYPISGIIAETWGLAGAYWFGAIVSVLALVLVAAVVPSSADNPRHPLDVQGALLISAGLTALLLAISQGESWGWASPRMLALLAATALLLVFWAVQQLRSRTPLVNLRLLRHPAVLTGDACALVLGIAMYMSLSAVTELAQSPRSTGYGFSASIVVAGLCLLPFSLGSLVASRALPRMTALVGQRQLLSLGCLVVAFACVFFAVLHGELWQAFVMMGILGLGVGSTFASLPGLIMRAIPESETGSAMGFYQVVRYVGFSLGSAVAASILGAHTSAGQSLPSESGYTLTLWASAVICIAAALVAWVLPGRGRPATLAQVKLAEEDAELAGAGLIGASS
jgi:MFS family permease